MLQLIWLCHLLAHLLPHLTNLLTHLSWLADLLVLHLATRLDHLATRLAHLLLGPHLLAQHTCHALSIGLLLLLLLPLFNECSHKLWMALEDVEHLLLLFLRCWGFEGLEQLLQCLLRNIGRSRLGRVHATRLLLTWHGLLLRLLLHSCWARHTWTLRALWT